MKDYMPHHSVNQELYRSLNGKYKLVVATKGDLDCLPENFLMIGNSLRSDVLPVPDLGGYAVHVPHHTT